MQSVDLLEQITGRELEVLELALQGKTNKEIAEDLHVSLSTIKTHIHNILQKTQLRDRKQLISKYGFLLNAR